MVDELEVVVTSGSTISPVDDVRHIGNFASGETGAKLAEEFLRQGHIVHYVYGYGAAIPFQRNASLDFDQGFEENMNRLRMNYVDYHELGARLILHSTPTFDEYYQKVWGLLSGRSVDAIVSVAAVNDYQAKKVDGKISSDNESLTIELEKCPKVISKFKQWDPLVYQVGFKLLSSVSEGELVDTAYEHGRKNRSNFTVANIKEDLEGTTYLVYPSYKFEQVRRDDLSREIVRRVESRQTF